MAKAKRSQDRKLVSYKQPYEVADICREWKTDWKEVGSGRPISIKKKQLLELVAKLPKRHSRKEVEACLIGAGYTKYPRKTAKQNGSTDGGFAVGG